MHAYGGMHSTPKLIRSEPFMWPRPLISVARPFTPLVSISSSPDERAIENHWGNNRFDR
jgi:hypothetical protein